MLLRALVFAIAAAGLAGFGAAAWMSLRAPAPPAAPVAAAPPAPERILVAAAELRAGQLLKPENIAAEPAPPGGAPAAARPDTPAARAELLGGLVRRPVPAGRPLLAEDVVRAGDRGFLAAVLGRGMRAASVGVDAVAGAAGLIWPGDHVDVILTQTIEKQDAPPGRRVAGETVLHDVRVIAVDQELTQGAAAGSPIASSNPQATRTVTLEVAPDAAERMAVAARLGRLSLAVLSAEAGGGEPAPAAQVVWGGDVSGALGARRQDESAAPSAAAVLHVFEGAADGKEYHF